jgi:hypothetical protein
MGTARRYRTSLEVDWPSPARETYEEGSAVFDVRRAKGYLTSHPVPVRYLPASTLAGWAQTRPSGRRNRGAARIDPLRVRNADPTVPLILAETPRRLYLIDGHHRLEQGRRSNYTEYPAVVLRDPSLVMSLMRGATNPFAFWWHWHGQRAAGPAVTRNLWGRSRPARAPARPAPTAPSDGNGPPTRD